MVIKAFPPLETADDSGLLAIGGDLEIESLLLAYSSGIFPWPIEDGLLAWFSPEKRAILELSKFRIAKSLKKEITKGGLTCTLNKDFAQVIACCRESKTRKGARGTWIIPEMVAAYINLHKNGYAHSVECWENGQLVGGLYGVSIAGMFAGESMFFKRDNASKVALAYLVDYLQTKGCEWIDCQVMNSHLKSLGATEVRREVFIEKLASSLSNKSKLF